MGRRSWKSAVACCRWVGKAGDSNWLKWKGRLGEVSEALSSLAVGWRSVVTSSNVHLRTLTIERAVAEFVAYLSTSKSFPLALRRSARWV